MKTISNFCNSLESVLGLEAVQAQWKVAVGTDWPWARKLLVPTSRLAECYPKLEKEPANPLPFDVICHDAEKDEYVGVCPESASRITLTKRALIVYALNHKALTAQIASALNLTPDYAAVDEPSFTYRIGGHLHPGKPPVCVYLSIPPDADALLDGLSRVAMTQTDSFLLLTPTRRHWRVWPQELRQRVRVVALETLLAVDNRGALVPSTSIDAILRPTVEGGTPGLRPDGVYPPRTIIFLGREHTCDLTPQHMSFLQLGLQNTEIDVHELMHPRDGLIFKQRYRRAPAQRNAISKLTSRVNERLLEASPPLRFTFSLARNDDVVVRHDLPADDRSMTKK